MTSYPNIAAGKCMMAFCEYLSFINLFILKGFRGFNVVLGGVEVPSNPAGKRGFIFVEAHERSSTVRFNNIAGEEHTKCKDDVEVRVIRTVEEMFEAKTSTKLDSTSSLVGPELNINAKMGADGTLSNDIMNSLGKLFGWQVAKWHFLFCRCQCKCWIQDPPNLEIFCLKQ